MKEMSNERAAVILEDLASEVKGRSTTLPIRMQEKIFAMAEYFGFDVADLEEEEERSEP